MLHVNEKYFNSESFVKRQFSIKIIAWSDVRQLRKNPRIFYFPESLQYENLKIITYVKEYFYMFFSTLKDIIQAQSETNPLIS